MYIHIHTTRSPGYAVLHWRWGPWCPAAVLSQLCPCACAKTHGVQSRQRSDGWTSSGFLTPAQDRKKRETKWIIDLSSLDSNMHTTWLCYKELPDHLHFLATVGKGKFFTKCQNSAVSKDKFFKGAHPVPYYIMPAFVGKFSTIQYFFVWVKRSKGTWGLRYSYTASQIIQNGTQLNVVYQGQGRTLTHLDIVDNKLVEAIRKEVSGFTVGAIANAWHEVNTLEPATHSVINALWFAPVRLCVCVCVWY